MSKVLCAIGAAIVTVAILATVSMLLIAIVLSIAVLGKWLATNAIAGYVVIGLFGAAITFLFCIVIAGMWREFYDKCRKYWSIDEDI